MRKSCGLVIASLRDTKEKTEELDELGFRSSHRSHFIPHDDAKDIQRWEGFLEFTIGKSWPSYRGTLTASSPHLSELSTEGVPVSLRPQLYALIGNIYSQIDESPKKYLDIYEESVKNGPDKSIEKDLLRTLPDNHYFTHLEDEGILRLRRILNAIRFYLPEYGYCQGMGMLTGYLLLILPEEHVFWLLVHLIKVHLCDIYCLLTLNPHAVGI